MQRVCSDLVRVSTWINTAQSTFPFQEGAQVTTIRPAANDTSDCLITSTPPEPSSVLHAVDKVDRQSGKDFETDVPCPPALVTHGPWHHLETKRLHMLVDLSTTSSQGRTDWDWVSRKFGPTRSRHQVLCKAVELGLKSMYPVREKVRSASDGANQKQARGLRERLDRGCLGLLKQV